jgi:hypothetical protein
VEIKNELYKIKIKFVNGDHIFLFYDDKFDFETLELLLLNSNNLIKTTTMEGLTYYLNKKQVAYIENEVHEIKKEVILQ